MSAQPEPVRPPKRLAYWDLLRSWVIWTFFSHSCYNYERLQGQAFAHSMVPIITKLYSRKEDIIAALKRHMVFFNTEPNIGNVIHGVVAAMEEQRANDQPISDEAINNVKMGLMGPMAGVGDTITQGTVAPILIAFGVSLASQGNLMGPVLYVLLMAAFIWGAAYTLFFQGYRFGKQAVERIIEGGLIDDLVTGAGIVGAAVMGALTAKFVTLSTPVVIKVGQQATKLQADVLDKLMPNLLPLALTLGVFYLLRRRLSPTTVLLIMVAVGLVGALIGLF